MNTSGHETETAKSDDLKDTTSPRTPGLIGPTIFVYVVSILMGIAAGLSVRAISDVMGYVGIFSGVLGGVVAAWFWTILMTRHIHNQLLPWKIFLLGLLWGLLAGWIGAAILWLFEWITLFSVTNTHNSDFMVIVTIVVIGFFASIGGLVAGLVCGGVWAIWTRSRK